MKTPWFWHLLYSYILYKKYLNLTLLVAVCTPNDTYLLIWHWLLCEPLFTSTTFPSLTDILPLCTIVATAWWSTYVHNATWRSYSTGTIVTFQPNIRKLNLGLKFELALFLSTMIVSGQLVYLHHLPMTFVRSYYSDIIPWANGSSTVFHICRYANPINVCGHSSLILTVV